MRLVSLIVLVITFSIKGIAQHSDSTKVDSVEVAPYQKTNAIPSFSMQLANKTWFSNRNIEKDKPTLIFYFNPSCGHCQSETEEILSKMKDLNNLQIVMVTSHPLDAMANFSNYFKLNRFPSIKIGSDTARYVSWFYNVKFTPFSALYDKSGSLVKVYEDGIDMNELIESVK